MGLFKLYQSEKDQKDIFGKHASYINHLNKNSNKEYIRLLPFIAKYGWSRLLRKSIKFKDGDLSDLMISIDPSQGRLFNQVMANKPNVIFEFGLSHGISSCYIGDALKRLSKGILYSTEIETNKISFANKNIDKLQLKNQIKIIEGDVLKSLENFKHNIDLDHMDVFPNLNLAVFKKLEPFLADNAVIITDDVRLFKLEMQPDLDYMLNPQNYSSVILKNSTGMMMSVKLSDKKVCNE